MGMKGPSSPCRASSEWCLDAEGVRQRLACPVTPSALLCCPRALEDPVRDFSVRIWPETQCQLALIDGKHERKPTLRMLSSIRPLSFFLSFLTLIFFCGLRLTSWQTEKVSDIQ